ncbi:hypothetical protein [uncultured Vagococcus sp.]|uniref:hypothetical protein n=1 Tax=uncultured Vagococcus sp. TaxID=189676 RepID=UPI002584734C|nr:hypothetical protein [uncultured Vagococcus sp.]
MWGVILLLLLFLGFIVPKLFPYMSHWIYLGIILVIGVFCVIVDDPASILIVSIFGIGFGFSAIRAGIAYIGQKNLERHIRKQQEKENNKYN